MGIYFHWGLYSVPAFKSEWYPHMMFEKGSQMYKHHLETYGDPSVSGYDKFILMFKAEHFDAEEWADLFVAAGARFAGPVAMHFKVHENGQVTHKAVYVVLGYNMEGKICLGCISRRMKALVSG